MSTLTVVKKCGIVAIAADRMTMQGSTKVPGPLQSHPSKIVSIGTSFIGSSGSTAHVRVMESLTKKYHDQFDLSSIGSIFETFRKLHATLVDEYYLMTNEDDDNQPYQSSQLNLLIANDTGIYEVKGYREVVEFERFWATGSGYKFALGAMAALYDEESMPAQQLAERGVEIGCLFDEGSGLPLESNVVKLKE
jgi:ATP-dependent protease HslVU (ClpYQ) peptidase subunit